jgi:hypothetical protein
MNKLSKISNKTILVSVAIGYISSMIQSPGTFNSNILDVFLAFSIRTFLQLAIYAIPSLLITVPIFFIVNKTSRQKKHFSEYFGYVLLAISIIMLIVRL